MQTDKWKGRKREVWEGRSFKLESRKEEASHCSLPSCVAWIGIQKRFFKNYGKHRCLPPFKKPTNNSVFFINVAASHLTWLCGCLVNVAAVLLEWDVRFFSGICSSLFITGKSQIKNGVILEVV